MEQWQTLDDFMARAWEDRDRQAWHDGKGLVREYGLEGDFDLVPSFVHYPGYGAEMVDADQFQDYAEQTAEDIGAISRNAQWPLSFIDWERAADALAQDYALETLDGHDYYVRER